MLSLKFLSDASFTVKKTAKEAVNFKSVVEKHPCLVESHSKHKPNHNSLYLIVHATEPNNLSSNNRINLKLVIE